MVGLGKRQWLLIRPEFEAQQTANQFSLKHSRNEKTSRYNGYRPRYALETNTIKALCMYGRNRGDKSGDGTR